MSGVSNHYDGMVQVKAVIEALGLTGVTGGIVIQEVCDHKTNADVTTLPFISISPYGPEELSDPNNIQNGVVYPILVAIMGKKDVTQLEVRLGWRQAIRNKFRKPLSTPAAAWDIRVSPGNVVEPSVWRDVPMFFSGMVLKLACQELAT